ncbi:HPr family phosphocarrier protein [Endozoicomonas sp. Mp262]|uniref:HPr family phosphocarrier protein n=1 Tax=Endozoicomonas sp. Mp262 TaxID=2919499 RepID=UPI0021DF7B81
MIKKQVTIINKLGLHARAASRFVSIASGFSCKVRVSFNGQDIDGKSIMAVMMLAAGQGSSIELMLDGHDEKEACDALCTLINNYFNEGE